MVGGLASSQIIIVHAGQIVVDQTHGMDHLQSNRGRHGLLLGTAKHFRGGQTQHGTDALSTGHEGIEHGFADLFGLRTDGNDRGLESILDGTLFASEVGIEVERGGCFGKSGGGDAERTDASDSRRLLHIRCKGRGWRHDEEGSERSGSEREADHYVIYIMLQDKPLGMYADMLCSLVEAGWLIDGMQRCRRS